MTIEIDVGINWTKIYNLPKKIEDKIIRHFTVPTKGRFFNPLHRFITFSILKKDIAAAKNYFNKMNIKYIQEREYYFLIERKAHIKELDIILDEMEEEKIKVLNVREWDGMKRFYKLAKEGYMVVSTGLVWETLQVIKKLGGEYVITDCFDDWDFKVYNFKKCLKGITLTESQVETIQWMVNCGRGILKADTGSGKTEIAIALSKWFLDNYEGEVLFLTHRKIIKTNVFKERLELRLEPEYLERVNYMMVQTFINQFSRGELSQEWLDNIGLVFCDEIHASELIHRKTNGKNVNIFTKALKNCYHRFGMSATPFKEGDDIHKFETMRHFGKVIEMENYECPVKVVVNMHNVEMLVSEDYPSAIEQLKTNTNRRKKLLQILSQIPTKSKTLIFVKHIEHGKRLSLELMIPFIYGETPQKERDRFVNALNTGKLTGLIVSSIFYFGVDIPEINNLILYHIEKSYINVLQAIGRGKRKSEGKTTLTVYDFYDKDRSYLEEHSKTRLKHYTKEGYTINRL